MQARIIEQDAVHIPHKYKVEELIAKGRDFEKIVLSHAVEKHIQRKIRRIKTERLYFKNTFDLKNTKRQDFKLLNFASHVIFTRFSRLLRCY